MTDCRKYLYVLPTLHGGGAERTAIHLLSHLRELGVDIDLLLFKDIRDHDTSCLSELSIHSLLGTSERISRNAPRFMARFLNIARRYDVLISGLELWPSYLVGLAGRLLRKKVIWLNHTCLSHYIVHNELSRHHVGLTRYFCRFAERIITVSIGTKQDLVRNFGISGDKVEVIYNPNDITSIQQLAAEPISSQEDYLLKKPVIISVGRVSILKGYDLLLQAAHLVHDRGIDFHLVFIGTGPEEESLKQLAYSLGLGERTFMLGFQTNPYKYMARADLFVLPSRLEGFSNVLVEAMACGCPVIACNCPSGPEEILDKGMYGRLVEMENVGDLAKGMIALLSDRPKSERFRELGMRRAWDFDIVPATERYAEVLRSV